MPSLSIRQKYRTAGRNGDCPARGENVGVRMTNISLRTNQRIAAAVKRDDSRFKIIIKMKEHYYNSLLKIRILFNFIVDWSFY